MGVQPEKKLFLKLFRPLFLPRRKLEVLFITSESSLSLSLSAGTGFFSSFRSAGRCPMSPISFSWYRKKKVFEERRLKQTEIKGCPLFPITFMPSQNSVLFSRYNKIMFKKKKIFNHYVYKYLFFIIT